ncbi:hypothetical protein PISMIDRAFT_523935 [Pisolithus microcarpus 441]|uniref:Uncharacterized protein n=1 Tax=Pisolithus microcarpus 441 TaxID=765257 RepID=A0A0D0A4F1_9AGAM|nr:hypothetical protein PISMIDRAFT_523935 [Pisolithus microcarpus 441]
MRSNLLARQQGWCFRVEPYSSYWPSVIRHADRRLKTVKVDCDKELYRVISRITTFSDEEWSSEGEQDSDTDYCDPGRETVSSIAGLRYLPLPTGSRQSIDQTPTSRL